MERREFTMAIAMSATAGCSELIENNTSTASTTQSFTRLEITSSVSEQVELGIQLSDKDNENILYEDTVSFDRGDTKVFDQKFSPGENYSISLFINGNTVFSRDMFSCEGYELIIQSKDNITIENHIER